MFNINNSQWSLFTNSCYTSGQSNTHLTILKNLFSDYNSQAIWKVELIVTEATTIATNQTSHGSTSILILVNFPPLPGYCSVTPTFGNTTNLFNIICNSWTDPDGTITNYAFYGK